MRTVGQRISALTHTLSAALLIALGSPALADAPKPLPAGLEMDGSETIEAPKSHDSLTDPRWCRVCHPAERFTPPVWRTTAHADKTCVDCHDGYHFNPHLPIKLGPGALDDELGATPHRRRDAARAQCKRCHADEKPVIDDIVHGTRPDIPGRPGCGDCHGEPHSIVGAETLTVVERRQNMNARCITCHADDALMEAAGLTTRSVETYQHSTHGRQLDLGSSESPGCVDCHSSHTLTDMKTDGVEACKVCHSAATPAFVQHADHRQFTRQDRPVSFFTLKFFAWLTFLVIFALCVHVLLDVFASVRTALRGRREDDS